jgi:hypothetical protein
VTIAHSKGWTEYLSGGPDAALLRDPIEDTQGLHGPSLFEVYRHLLSTTLLDATGGD